MNLSDMVRAMAASGCSAEQIAVAVASLDEGRRAKARAGNAERQRRFRSRNANNAVTGCDDTLLAVSPEPQKEKSPTPPKRKTNTPNNPSDCFPLAAETAPRKAKRAKPRTSILETTQPSDADKAMAEKYGLSKETFRNEWRMFRNHHISRGSVMADWPAAWRTWLDKSVEFGRVAKPAEQIEAAAADTNWRGLLEMFCKTRTWQWGRLSPEPGAPGCKIPAEIIAEFAEALPERPLAVAATAGSFPRLSLVPIHDERAA